MYQVIGSRKIFTRGGVCKIELLLAHQIVAAPRPPVRVWEPFGKYYYELGSITVAPAGAQ